MIALVIGILNTKDSQHQIQEHCNCITNVLVLGEWTHIIVGTVALIYTNMNTKLTNNHTHTTSYNNIAIYVCVYTYMYIYVYICTL